MESVVRGLAVYFFLLLVFRIAGKRTLAEATAFDFALLLIISETIQEAIINRDQSLTNAAVLIVTLVGADLLLSFIKHRVPPVDLVLDGTAVILLRDGQVLQERLDFERVDKNDILEAARIQQGLESLDQIKLAVLERGGEISIIPRKV